MKFNWNELLDLARFLRKKQGTSCSDEACLRTSINRSYYSIYCLCRDFALYKEGFTYPRRMGKHTALIEYYRDHPDSLHQDIGNYLDRLFGRRMMADYHNEYADDLDNDCGLMIPVAQRALNALSKIKPLPTSAPTPSP